MIRYLSLFSGAGLLDSGLHSSVPALSCVAACELDPTRRRIFGAHFPGARLFGDVAELARAPGLLGSAGAGVEGIVAGIPCNLFSTANTSASNTREISDGPAKHALSLVSSLRPRWCLFESSGRAGTWARWVPAVRGSLWARGHASVCVRLCPAGRGAPHERPRAFVFSWRSAADSDRDSEPARAVHAEASRLRAAASTPWDGRIPPGFGVRLDHGADVALARAIGYGVDQRSAQDAGGILGALIAALESGPDLSRR